MGEGKTLRERMLVEGTPMLQRIAKHNTTFIPCTMLGGYPIVYIDGWHNQLCSDCAEARLVEAESYDDLDEYVCWREDQPHDAYIFHEGASIFCDDCNKEIESAYGDPWAEDEEEDED